VTHSARLFLFGSQYSSQTNTK